MSVCMCVCLGKRLPSMDSSPVAATTEASGASGELHANRSHIRMIDRVPGPRRTGPSIIITAVTKQLVERVPGFATARPARRSPSLLLSVLLASQASKTPSAGPCLTTDYFWDTCSGGN